MDRNLNSIKRFLTSVVALRKESVDRNVISLNYKEVLLVALRKESVDRNYTVHIVIVVMHVALRKESVDRNGAGSWPRGMNPLSLSARRAWIEICRCVLSGKCC